MKKQKMYQLTTCALMAALMCILGPMSIPIGPIPVSFTNFVIFLSVYLLGVKGATISYLVYLLLGAVGLPVFSGYQGGLAKLAGPTGGYLVGFILTALISGVVLERFHAHAVATILGMMVSMVAAYYTPTYNTWCGLAFERVCLLVCFRFFLLISRKSWLQLHWGRRFATRWQKRTCYQNLPFRHPISDVPWVDEPFLRSNLDKRWGCEYIVKEVSGG